MTASCSGRASMARPVVFGATLRGRSCGEAVSARRRAGNRRSNRGWRGVAGCGTLGHPPGRPLVHRSHGLPHPRPARGPRWTSACRAGRQQAPRRAGAAAAARKRDAQHRPHDRRALGGASSGGRRQNSASPHLPPPQGAGRRVRRRGRNAGPRLRAPARPGAPRRPSVRTAGRGGQDPPRRRPPGGRHGAAIELLIEAKLVLGRHVEVIGQLESLVDEHPYREGLRAQLMLALYRADRQADALRAYQDARRMLVEELGIEPGERLRALEAAVLAQDPALAAPVAAPPPPAVAAPRPPEKGAAARRLVSIVFADLVGSTGLAEHLDPETMHRLLDRYSEACGVVIERHGGSVEGFIGDAVVGVFGQEEVHEDDALRAVRAAVEMRDAGAALSSELERELGIEIAMKLGVESGEVFVGAGARRSPFAAGDAFNVAARLEGTAAEGEILLGENVHRLLRGAVRAERLEPLALKGRSATVQAWRLVGLDADDTVRLRAPRSPFVDRAREIEALRAAFARACEEEACRAVAVVGPAGVGKSPLARGPPSLLEGPGAAGGGAPPPPR